MMTDGAVSTLSIPIPREFFDDLLPGIRDLAELKAALYVFHLATVGGHPGVPFSALCKPSVAQAIVGRESPEPIEERLQRTLERTVANGVLLRFMVRRQDTTEQYFLPASRQNRALFERLRMSQPDVFREIGLPADASVSIYRPNVFAYYEQHIGPLTPLVAEQLREAEASYPRAWIEEAIQRAEQANRRHWRYIEAILLRWEEIGGPERTSLRPS
jgi:DnaD/phage-associated family protein